MAVTLSLFAGAGAQFFDNTGNVLSGGKIYTYQAGTTTPLAVYTSNNESAFHTNPIILDAAGRVPSGGEIWLQLGVGYKFVVKTSTDVLIATYDNIPSSAQQPAANDADSIMYEQGYTVTAGNFVAGKIYRIVSIGTTNFTLIGAVSNTIGLHFIATGVGTGTGTAELSQTVEAKLQQTISVKDFGAVGDGVADDTAAIEAALASLVSGGSLLFNPGTYKVTSSISQTFNNGAVVNIIGYGAKIDGTSVTGGVAGDTTLITLGGARLTGVALGANAAKYATSITTASPISAAVNDIALITSTDLWNPTRPYYYKGEMIEMRSIVGNTIGSHIPLYDSYTDSTTTVHALSMPTVNVEGLEVEMNANQLALMLRYCRNPSVRHTKVHGARYTGISIQYCFGGTVDSNEVYDAWTSGLGTSYCVAISTCQNFVVSKNNLTEARHCITGGGREPDRNIIYAHNICTVHPSETIAAAIDHHASMEFCIISDNVANGGITISSINSTIRDNIVTEFRSSVAQAINIYQEGSSDYYVVSGNSVTTNNLVAGFWYSPAEPSLNVQDFTFNDNNIKSGGRSANFQPRNSTVTGCSIQTLSVKNNSLESTGASQAAFVHSVNGAATLTTEIIDSANNTYRANLHDACTLTSPNISNTFSTNDKFYANRLNGSLVSVSGLDVSFLNPYFEGNIGGAGTSRAINYTATGVVRCINPVFKNMQFKAELQPGGPTLYIEQGWYEATPTIINSSGARLVNFYGALGRAITYSTAAPVAGTWAVGDRVYNQVPVVGQPKSWTCTVAGTPGTWVSEGNL